MKYHMIHLRCPLGKTEDVRKFDRVRKQWSQTGLESETLISETELQAFVMPHGFDPWYTGPTLFARRVAIPIPPRWIVQMPDESDERQLLTKLITDIAYIIHHENHWTMAHLSIGHCRIEHYDNFEPQKSYEQND